MVVALQTEIKIGKRVFNVKVTEVTSPTNFPNLHKRGIAVLYTAVDKNGVYYSIWQRKNGTYTKPIAH